MTTSELEDVIDLVKNPTHRIIINLIINAVEEYPLNESNDIDIYFHEIKDIIGSKKLSRSIVLNFLENNDINNIWLVESMNSLYEAFDLMKIHKIPFSAILKTIHYLDKHKNL